jgi:hypothetical protein
MLSQIIEKSQEYAACSKQDGWTIQCPIPSSRSILFIDSDTSTNGCHGIALGRYRRGLHFDRGVLPICSGSKICSFWNGNDSRKQRLWRLLDHCFVPHDQIAIARQNASRTSTAGRWLGRVAIVRVVTEFRCEE